MINYTLGNKLWDGVLEDMVILAGFNNKEKEKGKGEKTMESTNDMTSESAIDDISQRNPVLEDAWASFAIYDYNSTFARDRFLRLRKWILGLGVAATSLAILHTVLKPVETPWVVQVNDFLRYLVILIPISVSILQAGSAKSKGGTNYTLLRGSAEALKREIYRFRAQVGIYGSEQTESRDVKLARKVKTIGGQLMKTEANQTALRAYTDKLPPYYEGPDDDDGFSDLEAEKYIKWRLEDQLNWYKGRTSKLNKQVHTIQWLILIFGGIGTFLAAIGLEVWIAVTVSLTAAFASLLELQQAEETLVTYNQTATDLNGIRVWWRALSDVEKAKQENKEKLVDYTETVFKTELAGWVQEMMDSLAELYAEEFPIESTRSNNASGS